jgi:hypothetical protein
MPVAPRLVFDAIVLAFSRSGARDIVGTDALRSALDGLAKDMITPDTLKLQPLWDLLESQPGFERNHAAPPILLVKTWQIRIGRTVELPTAFGDVTDEEASRYAAECKVTPEELDRALTPRTPPAVTPAPPPIAPTTTPRPAKRTTAAPPVGENKATIAARAQKRRKVWMIISGTAVVAAIISITITLWPGRNNELDAAALTTEIPLAHVRKSGAMIGAVLTDPSWLSKPEDVRRKQLEDALAKVHGFDATQLMVFDARGQIVASAHTSRNKLVIAFPKAP